MAIVSTQNGNIDRVADADVLFFSNFEIPSTLAAFEGTAVTAIIYGNIVRDSQLEITSMSLAPDEASHGCVDEGSKAKTVRRRRGRRRGRGRPARSKTKAA